MSKQGGFLVIANFDAIARAYKSGDKTLRRKVGASLRKVAKPLGEETVKGGALKLPRGGGLSERVATNGKVGISAALGGQKPRVSIRLRTRQGYDLQAMNRGRLRHPVWNGADRTGGTPAKRVWVNQLIPDQAFTHAFEAGAPKVRSAVVMAARQTLDEIARQAK